MKGLSNKRIVYLIGSIFDRIVDYMAGLACIIIGVITLIITFDILLRLVTRTTLLDLTWIIEISEYSLLFVTFLAATWALKKGLHFRLDIFFSNLKPKTQDLLTCITSIIGAIVMLIFAWYSLIVTIDYFVKGITSITYLRMPLGYIMLIMPLGSFFLVVQFVRDTYSYWLKLNNTN